MRTARGLVVAGALTVLAGTGGWPMVGAIGTAGAAAAQRVGGPCTAREYGTVTNPSSKTPLACALVGDGRYQWVQLDGTKARAAFASAATGAATPTTTAATTAAVGKAGGSTSMEKPGGLGTMYVLPDADDGNIDVVVRSIDLDAGPEIRAENQFNKPAAAGTRYILVNATVTYHAGKAKKSLTGLLGVVDFSVFGKSGVEGRTTDCSAVVPNQLDSFRALLDGASLSGNLCFRVTDADAAAPLTLRVDESLCFSNCDEVWVKLS